MIHAIHGFLGLATDWAPFTNGDLSLGDLRTEDLWADAPVAFSDWAKSFNARVEEKPILLGYSLGGRLAMHAALAAPGKFRACIFVSANPGFVKDEDREPRRASDHRWAERFRKDPWSPLLKSWDEQPVFRRPAAARHALNLLRPEARFNRERLASALEIWSLSEQANLREKISALKMPVLHLTGSEDTKFTALMRTLPLGGTQRHQVIKGSGHRLPWEQPTAFAEAVNKFIAEL